MPEASDPAGADTIFALSSGQPPAGIAVVRISGSKAGWALSALTAGRSIVPREAKVRTIVDHADGSVLDHALTLWLPGPATATGEDIAELHLHGGRAIVSAVLRALDRMEGLRPAIAGEYTRRAFEHGRIDLIEAEALGDLLVAETEGQRRSAMILAQGGLSKAITEWQTSILILSAKLEAVLDFSDEDDVDDIADIAVEATRIIARIDRWLDTPPAERLRDGVRVVIAGPPNAGKSTLFNALVGRDAAIVTPLAGTTRDVIEAPVALDGVALLIIDTAGLREADDVVEAIGVARASAAIDSADVLLWLGRPEEAPSHRCLLKVGAQADHIDHDIAVHDLILSIATGQGLGDLRKAIVDRARALLPGEGESALNRRQRDHLVDIRFALFDAASASDPLLAAESLRVARFALDALTGRAGTEDMFDVLFGAFCIGK